MEYEYKVGEVYHCDQCGLKLVITVTAAPVQELSCCGEVMKLVKDADPTPDAKPDSSKEYKVGDEYYCPVCGIECRILSSGNPSMPFSCCGVPMELK